MVHGPNGSLASKGGPQPEAEDRQNVEFAAKLTRDKANDMPVAAAVQVPARIVRRGRRDAPVAYVSLLVPSERRRCWWYLVTCRVCGAPHLGRARQLEDVTGPRRLPCGHRVTIMVARTYGQRREGGAA